MIILQTSQKISDIIITKRVVLIMGCKVINNVQVNISGDIISDEELLIYLNTVQAKQKRKIVKADINVDGEYVDVNYVFEYIPFERIRRITGYLVGTTDRWNNAKQAELKDRVKHG